MSSRTRTAFITAPVAAALFLSACSGGSSATPSLNVTYKDVAAATRTAGPARTSGSANGPNGGKGPVKGTVEGDLTGSGAVSATLITGTTRNDVQVLWIDKALYVKRAEAVNAGALTDAGTQAWMLRAPTERAWSKRSVSSQFTPELFSPFAPAALADLLATRQMPVQVTSDGSQRKMHAEKPLAFLGAWTNATVDLWVDGHERVTRVQITSKQGGMSYDVKYGGSAPDVAVPPPSQIDTPVPTTPKPAGPFVTVRSGNTDGVAWSLQRAPGTPAGYECWRWQATPAVKIVAADEDGNRCIPEASRTDDPSDQTAFVASTDGKGKYDMLAVRLPANARTVGVSPISGQPTTATVSGDTFVWVGPATDKAGSAFIILADGTRLFCGPGWISLPSDWTTVSPADKARLLASPWVCSPPS